MTYLYKTFFKSILVVFIFSLFFLIASQKTYAAIGCDTDADCPTNQYCSGGACRACSCSWRDDACGGGSCSDTQRHQTRVCSSTSCAGSGNTQCVSDTACSNPGSGSECEGSGTGIDRNWRCYSNSAGCPNGWNTSNYLSCDTTTLRCCQ